tara:strand:- start:935 stop:1177 length:243 start_codon:yes stop_codon:yes gene_type:complete
MATEEEVIEVILRPLLSLYKQPKHWDSEERVVAAKEAYVAALKPFSRRSIENAKIAVIGKHLGWEMPTVAELVKEAHLAS